MVVPYPLRFSIACGRTETLLIARGADNALLLPSLAVGTFPLAGLYSPLMRPHAE
jgi:hypothetical protein